jgi:hypothetical protein
MQFTLRLPLLLAITLTPLLAALHITAAVFHTHPFYSERTSSLVLDNT